MIFTLIAAILAATSLIAAEAEPSSQAIDDEFNQATLARLAADINGDGIPDKIVSDTLLTALNGANSTVLWWSTCTMPEWGVTNQLGRVFSPVLYDINEDALDEFIFSSRGCKAIVAINHRTGKALWQLPWKETLGVSGGTEKSEGVDWWERDLRLEGDQLLVAVRKSSSTFATENDESGTLVALDPHTGGLLWKAPMPLEIVPLNMMKYREGFDAVRAESGGNMTLHLRRGGSAVHIQGAPAPVAIGNVSVGVSISMALPITLQGIADTARFLIADGRAIAASLKEVGSVSLEDGRRPWTWRFPKEVKIFNPVLLSHGGRVFVVGWRNKATHAGEVFVAAIDAASGRGIWQRLFDDGFPTGTAMDPVLCKMRLTAGEEFAIDYESPKKDVPSRRVVLDSETGKTITDTKL